MYYAFSHLGYSGRYYWLYERNVMASKTNYFKIGLFVICSIVVIVIFTIALGLGSWGKKHVEFETYIDESVQGLNIGSPVKHRGVQIGSVKEITFVTAEYKLTDSFLDYSRYVMVIITTDSNKLDSYGYGSTSVLLDKLIEKGLRVRLTTQALTGISYLEVDYFNPDEYPPLEFSWKPKRQYIPSAPSVFLTFTQSIDQTLKKLEHVDIVEISNNLNELLVSSNKTLKAANVDNLSQKLFQLIEELRITNTDLKDVVGKAGDMMNETNMGVLSKKLEKLLDNIDHTTTGANSMLADITDTNRLVKEMLKPESTSTTTIPELVSSVDQLVVEIKGLVNSNRTDIESVINKLDYISSDLMDFSNNIKQDPAILLFSKEPAPSEIVK